MYLSIALRSRIALVSAAGALVAQASADQPYFRPLGDLPEGRFSSRASGISADGSVIVGTATSAHGTEAFRWTAESGMLGLGDLPGGEFMSEATGVSADGSVVV